MVQLVVFIFNVWFYNGHFTKHRLSSWCLINEHPFGEALTSRLLTPDLVKTKQNNNKTNPTFVFLRTESLPPGPECRDQNNEPI